MHVICGNVEMYAMIHMQRFYMFQIQSLRARGQHFLEVPNSYYDNLRVRLSKAKIHVNEDIDTVSGLKQLNVDKNRKFDVLSNVKCKVDAMAVLWNFVVLNFQIY